MPKRKRMPPNTPINALKAYIIGFVAFPRITATTKIKSPAMIGPRVRRVRHSAMKATSAPMTKTPAPIAVPATAF